MDWPLALGSVLFELFGTVATTGSELIVEVLDFPLFVTAIFGTVVVDDGGEVAFRGKQQLNEISFLGFCDAESIVRLCEEEISTTHQCDFA